MTANESFPQNIPPKRAVISRGQVASQRLLATLALCVLIASVSSMGILMVVLADIVPTVGLVIRSPSQ